MMTLGSWTVIDCGACGALHPVCFDGYAGLDGDDVYECPVVGRVELSSLEGERVVLREIVSVEAVEP